MKRVICFLVILPLLFGCKREGGKLLCTLTYNISNNKNAGYNTKSNTDMTISRYSQFGDFITSITPGRFVAKFLDLRLFDETLYGVTLVYTDLDIADPKRLADFSNNSSVSFIPEEINVRNDVELTYLYIKWMFFYQEFELPWQYENFRGNMLQFLNLDGGFINNFDGEFIGIEKTGCLIKCSHNDFVAPLFDPNWTGFKGNYPNGCRDFVFGNTNSTYVFYSDVSHVPTADNPLGQSGYIVRSNKYTPITLSSIPDGETKTIKGTMSFNTTDLIQIYAGKDNIPYTKDDYFVYAPNFWERISVSLESY